MSSILSTIPFGCVDLADLNPQPPRPPAQPPRCSLDSFDPAVHSGQGQVRRPRSRSRRRRRQLRRRRLRSHPASSLLQALRSGLVHLRRRRRRQVAGQGHAQGHAQGHVAAAWRRRRNLHELATLRGGRLDRRQVCVRGMRRRRQAVRKDTVSVFPRVNSGTCYYPGTLCFCGGCSPFVG